MSPLRLGVYVCRKEQGELAGIGRVMEVLKVRSL